MCARAALPDPDDRCEKTKWPNAPLSAVFITADFDIAHPFKPESGKELSKYYK